MEKLFKQYEKLIWSRAHSFAKSTGHDVEELHAIGCLAFVDKVGKFNSERGALSTFVYHVVNNAIKEHIKNEQMQNHGELNELYNHSVVHPKIEREINLKQKIAMLGEEAREVADVLFNCPAEFLELFKVPKDYSAHRPCHIKRALKEYFQKKGWHYNKVRKALKEIQTGTM